MPPGIRSCPACGVVLEPNEALEVIEGQKAQVNPKVRPPKVEIRVCKSCKAGFLGVMVLLHEQVPNLKAIIWPEDDPRRPNQR